MILQLPKTARRLIPALVLICIGLVSAANGQSEVATVPQDVTPLKVGDKAATGTVYDAAGNPVHLADAYSSAPTVLLFYRGGWCPYCTVHLGKIAAVEDQLTSAGYQIFAISPDAPQFLEETAAAYNVGYELLSDSSAELIKAFGLAFRVDDETFEKYRMFKTPIDLEKRAGKTHHILPVPAAYIVDQSGTIRFAYFSPDYKVRVDEKALLKAALEVAK